MGNTHTLDHQKDHDISLNLLEISKEVQDDVDGTRIAKLVEAVLSSSCKAESWPDQKTSSPEEVAAAQKKVLSFLKVQDKWTALGSILLKSQAFHVVRDSPETERVVAILPRTEHRKPYIPTDKEDGSKGNLYPLSISHQFPFIGGTLVINEGKRTQPLVGLDIVAFDGYNKKLYSNEEEFLEVFRDSFAEEEWAAINSVNDDRLKEFYVRWATKEAYTKALGVGLGFEFNSFQIQFKSFETGGLTNTGLWNHTKSSKTGTYLSGTLSGGVKDYRSSSEIWDFFFLPLQMCHGVEEDYSGCACVCLGPFASLATKPRIKFFEEEMTMNFGTFALGLCLLVPALSFQSMPAKTLSQRRTAAKPSALSAVPKLIVFDLDNTAWTPELYQLRKLQRERKIPKAGKDVELMEGMKIVLEEHVPELQKQGVQFAVASRTKSVEWAHSLLDQFELKAIFHYIEIFPGNKRKHFQYIQRASGVDFADMLFFDDARDGKYGNCEPVSDMGVLSVHCPNGIYNEQVFTTALEKFREWDRSPNHIVEWDGKVTNTAELSTERVTGTVKKLISDKMYGFVLYREGGKRARDLFFHFNSLVDGQCNLEEGDEVSFQVRRDPRSGKLMAVDVDLENAKDADTVQMRVFSMNMPFAALLANGYKTLETRNGTMFTPYTEGTQMLLHVGRRTYPDGNKHLEVMKSGGLSDSEIEDLKKLPPGFGRGNAVAIVELGETYETTLEERSDPDFQRSVGAYGADSGRMVTEIRRAAYLKKPVKLQGAGGVFKVQIDPDVIPDGWRVPALDPTEGLIEYASISG